MSEDKDFFKDLDQEPNQENRKKRAIFEPEDDWPPWQRWVAAVINASGVFLWAALTFLLIGYFDGNDELAGFRNAYMNLTVSATLYGILSLVGGLTLVSWLFPYFQYRKTMRSGTPAEKAACMQFWGAVAIALSIIIASVA